MVGGYRGYSRQILRRGEDKEDIVWYNNMGREDTEGKVGKYYRGREDTDYKVEHITGIQKIQLICVGRYYKSWK